MKNMDFAKGSSLFQGLIAFMFVSAIIIFPLESYQSALSGLNIFLQSVFPALLPFFITSEIMIGLGVVDFISVLLNPIMEPLFCCPGDSSFIWVMSMTSGYPAGARLTAMFLKHKRITPYEAQRILTFSSTSGPLFMMGAVAIGMMGTKIGGLIILLSHYIAALFLGLCFRFYHSKNYLLNKTRSISNKVTLGKLKQESNQVLLNAILALSKARKEDGRPFGQLIGDAVRNSVNVLWTVGGFIVLFSVLINLMMHLKIIDWLSAVFSIPMKLFLIKEPIIKAITGGLFEVTTGCKLVSEIAANMQEKIAAVSFIIGWSGLSIHAQSASFLSGTGVKISIYMLSKFLHGLLATIISLPLTKLLYPEALETISTSPHPAIIMKWRETLLISSKLLLAALFLIILLIMLSIILTSRKKAISN